MLRTFLRVAVAAAGASAALLSTPVCTAAEPVPPRPADPPPPMRERWYGWQTLALDGASIAIFTAGVLSEEVVGDVMIATGVAGYSLGGPIVHFAHGSLLRGLGSFALRVPMPLILAFGTVSVVCEPPAEFCAILAAPAALIGMTAAITLDAAVLSRDTVPVEPKGAAAGLRLAPTFSLGRRGASVGLALTL